jgi:hypothetical protein
MVTAKRKNACLSQVKQAAPTQNARFSTLLALKIVQVRVKVIKPGKRNQCHRDKTNNFSQTKTNRLSQVHNKKCHSSNIKAKDLVNLVLTATNSGKARALSYTIIRLSHSNSNSSNSSNFKSHRDSQQDSNPTNLML